MLWYLSCAGWHGTNYFNWINSISLGFMRGGTGVFSFHRGEWVSNVSCGRGVAAVLPAVQTERVTDELCDEA